MRRTGLVYDDRFLLHDTGPGHPERPERLTAIRRGIEDAGLLPRLTLIEAVPARLKWIEAVHSPKYIYGFQEACLYELGEYGHVDNQISRESYDVALLAVGGVLEAVRGVMDGRIDNAFCAVRPPGHHAEPRRALGFCFFNNVAIVARYLQSQWGVERIAIVDVDAHHGNGTQRIFEDDPSVFFCSVHEHPSFSFPGSGREFEVGYDAGEGFTFNATVLPGQGDDVYQQYFNLDLLPALERFAPRFVLVSMGFDAHCDDDMSDLRLTSDGYAWIAERLVEVAERHAGGKIVTVLEGGYDLARLPELAAGHVRALLGR